MPDKFLSLWENSRNLPLDILMREAPVMAHSIDSTGHLLNVSAFWANRLGYTPEEMIGSPSTDFLTEKSRIEAETIFLPKFFRDGRLSGVRYRFLTRDMIEVPVIMNAVAIQDKGKFERSVAIFFDNGIAAKLAEISSLLEDSASAIRDAAATLEGNERDNLEAALNRLEAIAAE